MSKEQKRDLNKGIVAVTHAIEGICQRLSINNVILSALIPTKFRRIAGALLALETGTDDCNSNFDAGCKFNTTLLLEVSKVNPRAAQHYEPIITVIKIWSHLQKMTSTGSNIVKLEIQNQRQVVQQAKYFVERQQNQSVQHTTELNVST